MRILRRCPYFDHATRVEVGNELVEIRPYQMILWASLCIRGRLSPRFPAILDTGHSLNFSIREQQLRSWTRIDPAEMARIGHATLNNRPVDLARGALAIYRNRPRTRDLFTDVEPFLMELPEGIVVHSASDLQAPSITAVGSTSADSQSIACCD